MPFTNLKDYFVDLLPRYIRDNDSYKDVNQKGFVTRYMEIFGEELDDNYYSKIEGTLDQVDPNTADSNMLDYIAINMGDLPDYTQTEEQYRRLLTFIISIYKIAGTKLSFEAILLGLGLDATLTELLPVGNVYDADPGPLTYDQDGIRYDESCIPCTDYDMDVVPFFMGLITDELDAATGWTLDAGSSIGTGQMTLVGVADAEAVKQFALDPNTNYTVQIDIASISGSAQLEPRVVNSNTLVEATAYITMASIFIADSITRDFTTNGDANQYLQLSVDTDTETIVIDRIRFWKKDTTLNPVMTGSLFEQITLLCSLVEPISARRNDFSFEGEVITSVFITVTIDAQGDLVYNNAGDPELVLTLVNGELVISGPRAAQYFLDGGDLFFVD